MTISHSHIDRIVQLVLQRLEHIHRVSNAMAKPQLGSSGPSPDLPRTVIDDRLVTLSTLQGRLCGTLSLDVPYGAVVTPTARDWLKEQNIELVFSRRTPVATTRSSRGQLLLATWRTSCHPQDLGAVAPRDMMPCNWCHEDDVMREMSEKLQTTNGRLGSRAVLFTDQPSVGLCELNRHTHLRAAQGIDAAAVREAVATLDNNVLVLDPRHRGQHFLRNLVGVYVAAVRWGLDAKDHNQETQS